VFKNREEAKVTTLKTVIKRNDNFLQKNITH